MVERTVQEQIVREAPEIEALKLGLIKSAKGLSDTAIQLPEQQIAGFTGLQTQAQTAAQRAGGIGGYEPLLTTGAGTLGTGLGTLGTGLGTLAQAQAPITSAQQAIAGSGQLFAPTDLSAYTNPYQQQVIDRTIAEINRQGDLARNQLAAQGVGARALGGSRFGVQSAELDRNLADSRARALAQLNAQNYTQALQTAQTAFENQQRRQQAQSGLYGGIASLYGALGQQQAGIGGQQAGIGGQQLGAAQLQQSAGVRDIATLQQLGQEQQRQQQAVLDAQRGNIQRQQYEPYSRVAFLSDIYKGAPSTQTILGSQVAPSAPTPSAFQQIAGVGTGLLGTAAAAKQLGGLF
jgi:hypothetical protein